MFEFETVLDKALKAEKVEPEKSILDKALKAEKVEPEKSILDKALAGEEYETLFNQEEKLPSETLESTIEPEPIEPIDFTKPLDANSVTSEATIEDDTSRYNSPEFFEPEVIDDKPTGQYIDIRTGEVAKSDRMKMTNLYEGVEDPDMEFQSSEARYGAFGLDKKYINVATNNKVENMSAEDNVEVAMRLYKKEGWQHFSSFKDGTYKQFLGLTDEELMERGADAEVLNLIDDKFNAQEAGQAKAIYMGESGGNYRSIIYKQDRQLMTEPQRIAYDMTHGVPLDLIFSTDAYDKLKRDFPDSNDKIESARNKAMKAQEAGQPDYVISRIYEALQDDLLQTANAHKLDPHQRQISIREQLDNQGKTVENNDIKLTKAIDKHKKLVQKAQSLIDGAETQEEIDKIYAEQTAIVEQSRLDLVEMEKEHQKVYDEYKADWDALQGESEEAKALKEANIGAQLDSGWWSGFKRGFIDEASVDDIPFYGTGSETLHLLDVKNAYERVEDGTGSEADKILLNDYYEEIDRIQQLSDANRGFKVGQGLMNSVTFMGEIAVATLLEAVTLGIAPALDAVVLKKISEKAVTKTLKKALKNKTTREAVKKYAGKALKQYTKKTLALVGATGTVNIPKGTFEREIGVIDTETGEVLQEGQPINEAIVNATTGHAVEIISEMGGGVSGKALKVLASPAKKYIAKVAIFNAFKKKLKDVSETKAMEAFRRIGYNGIVGEWFEERDADIANDVLYELGLGDQNFQGLTLDDIVDEFAMFGLMGGGINTAVAVANNRQVGNLVRRVRGEAPVSKRDFDAEKDAQLIQKKNARKVEEEAEKLKAELDEAGVEEELEETEETVEQDIEQDAPQFDESVVEGAEQVDLGKADDVESQYISKGTIDDQTGSQEGEEEGEHLRFKKDGITLAKREYHFEVEGDATLGIENQGFVVTPNTKATKFTVHSKNVDGKRKKVGTYNSLHEARVAGDRVSIANGVAEKTKQEEIDFKLGLADAIEDGRIKEFTREEIRKKLEAQMSIRGLEKVVETFKQEGVGDNQLWVLTNERQSLLDAVGRDEKLARQKILDSDLRDDVDIAKVFVKGKNTREIVDGIKKDVFTIWKGGSLATPIEERAEAWVKSKYESDAKFESQLGTWREEYEQSTGIKAPNSYDANGNLEWFSTMAVDYAFGVEPKGKIHKELRKVLDAFKKFAEVIFKRANNLNALVEAGEVNPQLLKALGQSLEEKVTPLQGTEKTATFALDELKDNVTFQPESYSEALNEEGYPIEDDRFFDQLESHPSYIKSKVGEVSVAKTPGGALAGLIPLLQQQGLQQSVLGLYEIDANPDIFIPEDAGFDFGIIQEGRFRRPVTGKKVYEMRLTPSITDKVLNHYEVLFPVFEEEGDNQERIQKLADELNLKSDITQQSDLIREVGEKFRTPGELVNYKPKSGKVYRWAVQSNSQEHLDTTPTFSLGADYLLNPKTKVKLASNTPQLSPVRKFNVGNRATLAPVTVQNNPPIKGSLRFESEIYRHEIYDTFEDKHNLMKRPTILKEGHPFKNEQKDNKYDLDELAFVLERDFPEYGGFIYQAPDGTIPIEWFKNLKVKKDPEAQENLNVDLVFGTFELSERKDEVKKIFEKETIPVEHYSWSDKIKNLNPDYYGTKGSRDSIERLRSNDKGFQNRTMVYVAGEKPEMFLQGTMKYEGQVKSTDIYDLINNPDGYDQTGNLTDMENEILKYYKGYMGIIQGRLAIAYFGEIPVKRIKNEYNSKDDFEIYQKKFPVPERTHFALGETSYPLASSDYPGVQITPLETTLQDAFNKSKSAQHPYGAPTVADIEALPKTGIGYPQKSTGKYSKLDARVRIVPYAELKEAILHELNSVKGYQFGFWYSRFGNGIKKIVGADNMLEASIIFGITSAQNKVAMNLTMTLYIMRMARMHDPVKNEAEFRKSLSKAHSTMETPQGKGRGLNIDGDNVNDIVNMYKTGIHKKRDSIKVTNFMQSVYLKSDNQFVPWIVNDIHMQRAFGFLGVRPGGKNKDGTPKYIPNGLSKTNQFYMTFMVAKLAQELKRPPDIIQAILWKHAKDKYGTSKRDGTWDEAFEHSQAEIKKLELMKNLDGELKSFEAFNEKNLPYFDEALVTKNKKGETIKGKQQYAHTSGKVSQDALYNLYDQRSGRMTISLNPGSNFIKKGSSPSLKMQQKYQDAVMKEITTQDGTQLLFLNRLNIAHRIENHIGSYGTVEQSFDIVLTGYGIEMAELLAPIFGSAFLQDSVMAIEPNYEEGAEGSLLVMKEDNSRFSEREILEIFAQVNPEQDTNGFNFTEVLGGHGLNFFSGNSAELKKILNSAEVNGQYKFGAINANIKEVESKEYEDKIEELSRSSLLQGTPDIFRTLETSLYKPVQEQFKKFKKRLGGVENPKFFDITSFDNQNDAFTTFELSLENQKDKDINDIIRSIPTTPVKKNAKMSLSKLYTRVFDDMNPIAKLVKEASKEKDISIDEDPYKLARMLRGWEGVVEQFLTKGTLDFNREINGESFNAIIEDAGGLDGLNAYLIASRAIDLQKQERFKDKTLEEISGFKDSALKHVHRKFNTKQYQNLAKRIYGYQDRILQFVRDSGLISEEQYSMISEQNKFYVPFYRVLDEEANNFNPVGGTSTVNVRSGLKYLKGSGRPIINPMESIIKNTYTLVNLALRNQVGNALVGLSETEAGQLFMQKEPTPMVVTEVSINELISKGIEAESLEDFEEDFINIFRPSKMLPPAPYVFITVDGKKQYYKLEQELYNAMTSLAPEQYRMLVKILSVPASTMRAGATLTGEFMGRNVWRDVLTASVYTSKGILFSPMDFVLGTLSLFAGKTGIGTKSRKSIYDNWKASGGDYAMLVSMDRAYFGDKLKEPLRSKWRRSLKYIYNPLNLLRAISSGLEAGTRLGEFGRVIRANKKAGDKTHLQTVLEAGYASREVTLDFSRKGAQYMKDMNKITAFFNAQLQGADKLVRRFKHEPIKSTIRALTVITLPSIALWLLNHDDEDYQALPAWQKDLFWMVKIDNKKFKSLNLFGDNFLRVPKPFELGIMFGSTAERTLDWVFENDKDSYKELIGSLRNAFLPDVFPTIGRVALELMFNYNFFYGSNIVNPYIEMQDISNIYKRRSSTSPSAIAFTELLHKNSDGAIDISPAKLDHLVYGLFAGVGRYVIDSADYFVVKAQGKDLPPKVNYGFADDPVIKGFVAKSPTKNTRWLDKFYEQYTKVAIAHGDHKWLEKNGTKQEVSDHEIKNQILLDSYEDYKSMADNISSAGKAVKAIEANRSLTPDAKREKIDNIWKTLTDLVRKATEAGTEFEFPKGNEFKKLEKKYTEKKLRSNR